MNTFDASRWLWDFYSWATVLLAVALVANFSLAQPARRIVIAWSTAWALLALALLTAVPNWSQYSLVASQPPKQVETPEAQSAPNAPPNFEQQTQQPQQQQIAFPPPNMAAVESAPPSMLTIDWSAMAMTGLLVGSSVVICWLALGAWQVRRLCASASPAPAEINRLLTELSQGNPPASQLGISKNLPVAVAVGLARPWILLPQTLTHANREHARSVLAHELAHVANRDLWLLAILRLLSVLLWPHPLFWLLRRQVRLDQELLADAAAAELTSRGTYAEQLVALARSAVDSRVPRLASSVGLWESPSQLTQRIALLLDDKLTILRNCSRSWRIGSAGMLTILALALSLVTLAPRVAQSRTETETTITEGTAIVPPEKFAELVKQSETTEGFANAVGDLVAAAIRPSQLPFISEKRLAAIRQDFVMFLNEHTPADITQERKTELLVGLRDQAQQHMRLWNKPITENRDLNNVYLDFNDRVKTLKWEFWMALTRKPLDKEALTTREAQRIWMRKTIADQPNDRHYKHAKVLEDLEATFADPLCVIFDRPMSDEAFAKFKSEIESWLAEEPEPNSPQKLERDKKSGLWRPVVQSQLPFMVHHFLWEALIAQYRGERAGFNGPSFDNDQIGGFGAGDNVIRLSFSSNHANEGSSLSLDDFEKSGHSINADTGYVADSAERGDFAFTERDNKMISINGAKLLPLPVFNWIEADAISVEDLKEKLTNSGVEEVDLGAFLQLKREQFIQDFKEGDVESPYTIAQNLEEALQLWETRQDGEGPYIAVLTNENNIAVAHLTDLRDRNFGSFYVRTRVRPNPVTDETVGDINTQAGSVAQGGNPLELKAETPNETTNHSVKPPKLLYLAWQSEDLRQTNSDKAVLWDPSGKELSREETKEFLSRASNIGFTQSSHPLTPLVLFFEVDPTINASVSTTIIASDGDRVDTIASSGITPTNGINTTSLGPMNAELEVWPSPVSLRLNYAIENWQVIKTVREFESLPIDVADGVRWYLDPTMAQDRDPQTGRSYSAEGKTAGILLELSEAVQNGLVDYAVRVYLKGEKKPVNELGVSALSRKDGNVTIRISEAFDSVDRIDRVEFIRQSRAVETIDNVPLRLDLLPKNGNRRYVPITPEGERRIDRDAYENGVFEPEPRVAR